MLKPKQMKGDQSAAGTIVTQGGTASASASGGLTTKDQSQTPRHVSTNLGETGLAISGNPVGYVAVYVDGLHQSVGDGVVTKGCYFRDPANWNLITFVQIAAHPGTTGESFASASRKPNGTIWAWGTPLNSLGDNTAQSRSSPVSVVGDHSFVHLAVGNTYLTALKADGSAWGWGTNTTGYVGDNTTTDRSSPTSVVGGHSFATVGPGIGLKSDGTAWLWGDNSQGAVGDQSVTNRSSPTSVIGNHSFRFVTRTSTFAIGLKADSTWAWGNAANGKLGQSGLTNRSSPVSVLGNHSFVFASVGGDHTVALKNDGSVWAWGVGTTGELGQSTTAVNRSSPISVQGNIRFISVSAGGTTGSGGFSVGIAYDGTAWTWGYNGNGQLGDNSTTNRSSPISVIGDHSFIAIAAGPAHVIALKPDGTIWAWGANSAGSGGAIGDNTTTDRSSPVNIVGFPAGSNPARSYANIVQGDLLVYNSGIAGAVLTPEPRVDLIYFE